MSTEIKIADELGSHLADVNKAVAFRQTRLEPSLSAGGTLVLDFAGVRHSNDSFINGLLTALFEEHGEPLLDRVSFRGCTPLLQGFVEGAIALGVTKFEERTNPTRSVALRNLFGRIKAEGRYDADYTGDPS